ncbi:uncharacterized protein LOC101894475 [Musca domestica]|uniref:Uncharacterized protein LOC101894475 n=1 Tax=Musca domestica TaxID=7370 RepID=A0A1I8MFJ2_MUSDO|nr:uncharacterized protein LOC101894475 [Musca domestica]
MCLYMGVAEHLVDILTFCVCRMIEMSIFVLMMTCGLTTTTGLQDEEDVVTGDTIIHSG